MSGRKRIGLHRLLNKIPKSVVRNFTFWKIQNWNIYIYICGPPTSYIIGIVYVFYKVYGFSYSIRWFRFAFLSKILNIMGPSYWTSTIKKGKKRNLGISSSVFGIIRQEQFTFVLTYIYVKCNKFFFWPFNREAILKKSENGKGRPKFLHSRHS